MVKRRSHIHRQPRYTGALGTVWICELDSFGAPTAPRLGDSLGLPGGNGTLAAALACKSLQALGKAACISDSSDLQAWQVDERSLWRPNGAQDWPARCMSTADGGSSNWVLHIKPRLPGRFQMFSAETTKRPRATAD